MSKGGKVESLTRRRLLRRLDGLLAANPGMRGRLAEHIAEQEHENMARAKTDTPKPATGLALNLRITPEDLDRLERMVERAPILTKHAIALAAMRIGLAAAEKDPALLLTGGEAPKGKRSK